MKKSIFIIFIGIGIYSYSQIGVTMGMNVIPESTLFDNGQFRKFRPFVLFGISYKYGNQITSLSFSPDVNIFCLQHSIIFDKRYRKKKPKYLW